MPANIFQGATMDVSLVIEFYVNAPNFDHFTFQQVLANPGSDNVYTLCAWAVMSDGSSKYCQLASSPNNSLRLPGAVQYANMKLYPDGLKELYPGGVKSDMKGITVVPAGPYLGGPNYMAYKATTPYMATAGSSVPINPSPPFNG